MLISLEEWAFKFCGPILDSNKLPENAGSNFIDVGLGVVVQGAGGTMTVGLDTDTHKHSKWLNELNWLWTNYELASACPVVGRASQVVCQQMRPEYKYYLIQGLWGPAKDCGQHTGQITKKQTCPV